MDAIVSIVIWLFLVGLIISIGSLVFSMVVGALVVIFALPIAGVIWIVNKLKSK